MYGCNYSSNLAISYTIFFGQRNFSQAIHDSLYPIFQ